MTNIAPDARRRILRDLIELRVPLDAAVSAVRALPWDSDADLAQVTVSAARHVLDALELGHLCEADLAMWAETIEGRDDVGSEPTHADVLREFIFAAANPDIARSVIENRTSWIRRLSS